MNGLSTINIELTSRCNKKCAMCGRRKMEREHPELCNWGDMPLDMVGRIAKQIPKGVLIQLHNSGEPLLYHKLAEALKLFKGHNVCLNTNGKLLLEQRDAIRQLSSITISVIPDDPESGSQMLIAGEFLELENRPLVIFRLLGRIDDARHLMIRGWRKRYPKVIICYRVLHAPEGSHGYEKPVTIPEIGICLEMLHKLAIDRFGNVYPCVRYDPEKKNLLGNLDDSVYQMFQDANRMYPREGRMTLDNVWNDVTRKGWVALHILGMRERVPLCQSCDFWGVPRG